MNNISVDKEYIDFVNQIMSLRRFGKKKGIEVSKELLDALGHPEKGMKIIHVAGTNGKGSVSSYVANCLMRLGFKVGLFTSPHLVDFNERIQVGQGNTFTRISHEDVLLLGQKILATKIESEPTMFDVCFVMALLYYKEVGCNYIVLETGLGGTYDSTTSIETTPMACVITSIGLEHTKYLGDTIEEVAFNKAGIIKPNSNVILSSCIPDDAKKVIENRCNVLGINSSNIYYTNDCDYKNYYAINNLVGYQIINAKTAISTLKAIVESDKDSFITNYMNFCKSKEEHCNSDCAKCVTEDKMCEISLDEWIDLNINLGISNTRWQGRLEKISSNVILDGAHNVEAFWALNEVLSKEYSDYNIHIVVGVLEDKDYMEELLLLKPLVKTYMTATIDDTRAKKGEDLCNELVENGCHASFIGNEEDVSKLIYDLVKKDNENSSIELYNDLYVVCGSLYFVGNVKRYLWQLQQE